MRVLHVLAQLNHRGAERMLACSHSQWQAAGVEPVIAGMADETHPFAPVLEEAGYEVHLLPGMRSVRGLAALGRLLRGVKPRVVHLHAESCFDLIAMEAVLSRGVEGIVRTVHNNFPFTGRLRARRVLRVRAARRLGVNWIACSPEVAETELAYVRGPIEVVENWVDVATIRADATPGSGAGLRQALDISPEAKVLTVIGNCGAAKNHELVARALDEVSGPVEVLHVGSRELEPESEKDAWRSLATRHTAHHLGPRDDVPILLAASDAVLLPSLYEGFPLAAIEGVCAGVPVLAADAVGLRWLSEIGSATLVQLDQRAWGQAIEKVLADGPGPETLRSCALEAQARFAPERGVAEYVVRYESALRGRLLLRPRRSFLPSRWGRAG